MKVISFHAYKGGRGRTTAIASIANLYARMGKHVALLDADVTAPWLHTRYDVSEDILESKGWLRGLLAEIASTPPSIVPKVDLGEYWVRVDGLGEGSVRLLAPGNPETPDYWRWMAEEFPRFLGVRTDPHIVESWRDLRALIASADPCPDILLVDAPAGYHRASAYVALAIADTAVFFAQDDHADAAWTTQMVTMIRREREHDTASRYGDLNMIGVRARFPDYALTASESENRYDEFREKYTEADFERWVSLEAEPRVETNEIEQPIPLEGSFDDTHLVKGYAELLAVALGQEAAAGEAFLKSLPEGVVQPGTRPQFFLLKDQGILLNPADEVRNVSFRVETFCGLLDDLHRELLEAAGIRDPSEVTKREALKQAGLDPGKRFGASLAAQMEVESPASDDAARIRRWCEFDSRVGFGGLEAKRIELGPEGNATAGTIEVAGNFLAAERQPKEGSRGSRDLCPLLSGYIEGVLSKLLRSMPASVEVNHPRELCMYFEEDLSSCEFEFAIAAQAPAATE